jgi:hypothetical protein
MRTQEDDNLNKVNGQETHQFYLVVSQCLLHVVATSFSEGLHSTPLKWSRGSFYSPDGPMSCWNSIWKALVAFCSRVHRTVRCTLGTAQCKIPFHKRLSCLLSQSLEPSVTWHIRLSGAHQTIRLYLSTVGPAEVAATWPPLIARRPLARSKLLVASCTRHVWCTPNCPVNYSQWALTSSREWPVRPAEDQPTSLGIRLSDAHRTVRWGPNWPKFGQT